MIFTGHVIVMFSERCGLWRWNLLYSDMNLDSWMNRKGKFRFKWTCQSVRGNADEWTRHTLRVRASTAKTVPCQAICLSLPLRGNWMPSSQRYDVDIFTFSRMPKSKTIILLHLVKLKLLTVNFWQCYWPNEPSLL